MVLNQRSKIRNFKCPGSAWLVTNQSDLFINHADHHESRIQRYENGGLRCIVPPFQTRYYPDKPELLLMISLAFIRRMFHVSFCGGIHCSFGEEMKNPARYSRFRLDRRPCGHTGDQVIIKSFL